jgi:hypothetical protein
MWVTWDKRGKAHASLSLSLSLFLSLSPGNSQTLVFCDYQYAQPACEQTLLLDIQMIFVIEVKKSYILLILSRGTFVRL